MSKNKTFFRNAKEGNMSLGDIFSDVAKRHSDKQTAKVLTAGTALTTPSEENMLADWQKPFLFARFFLGYVGFLLLSFVLGSFLGYPQGYYMLLVGIPFLIPVTLLLLVFEMNVPRNISLYEVITTTAIGGMLSLLVTGVLFDYVDLSSAAWAGVVEEPAKLIVIYLILSKKNYKYALNGALLGAAVGTGFAVMESIGYVMNAVAEGLLAGAVYAVGEGGMTFVEVIDNFGSLWINAGVVSGLKVAILRAIVAISGHGVFAALYGAALVKAKGEEEIRPTHLVNPGFLLYFAISILLHALHNYGIDLGLPMILDLVGAEYLIIAAIAVILLLNTLHIGVNQAVAIALSKNDGRMTMAVTEHKQDFQPMPPIPSGSSYQNFKLKCISGPYEGKKFRCNEGQSFTVGRDPQSNAIAVPECKYVGSVHCRIEVSGGRMYVTDLTSKNGTYLDNQRLSPNQPMSVLNNSVIQLGNEACRFRITIE